ncbi:centrosomal protein of 78 kDa isoform X2 [Girardinichthys multiradiatus]|uniref:centrosomal protein of 78 kDa isoform X2 n=1 Tax=Girardinichthys multiradiatus TaxID=208333 RepID=UPI001FACBAE1|nr:centrosomal protein of 78 kDa isoform X2 [Girardinichthys multiradiatus]
MVQGNSQIRRQGAHDFLAYYEFCCARQDSVPLPAVKINLDKGMLDFNGDRVKLTDWPPILHSISINKHLHHIAISSTYQGRLASADSDKRYSKSTFRRKIPAIRSKDLTFKLCKALRECLTVSPILKTLHLSGLPLRERDLITLTKGLAKSASLENCFLTNCPISDEGLEVICQSVKYSASIRSVDFTGCNLTWRGAEHMANIIKHQAMQRHGTAWAESLRYRLPQFEGMSGLRRVTLNCNTLIGDRGAAALAHELSEDLWVKDKVLIKTVIEKVLMNAEGKSPEYCWIKPTTTESNTASGPKRGAIPFTVRRRSTYRKGPHKGTSPKGQSSGVAQTKKPFSRSCFIPWRAAERAGRQRGLPPGVTVVDRSFQGATTVKVTVESNSEAEEDCEDEDEEEAVKVEQTSSSLGLMDRIPGRQFDRIQMELKECRLRLAEECRARLKAESRLMEYELENARLRDANRSLSEALVATGSGSALRTLSALEDEAVLESIENSFNKFHAFLDLLKDAGLGQLASVAGINTSDFQPLGKPQLSSTMGPQLEGAASMTLGEFRDVHAEADNVSLAGKLVPSFPGGTAFTHSCLSPSLHKDRLVDVTFNHHGLEPADPAVAAEEEPHQYCQPDMQPDSGSEHSFRSQKSFDQFSIRKTLQTQPSRQRIETSSNRSNSYHGNDFSNNSMYSRASQNKGTHSGSNESVSEIISDKVGSVGSWSSGKDSPMVGQPRSEGSERRAYPGRRALRQIGSLRVQSDDESF